MGKGVTLNELIYGEVELTRNVLEDLFKRHVCAQPSRVFLDMLKTQELKRYIFWVMYIKISNARHFDPKYEGELLAQALRISSTTKYRWLKEVNDGKKTVAKSHRTG